ncbi:hypothetical protein LguiB_033034 [Lonicera macranthoides]
MAYYLKYLKQEVEETKRELKQLKAREIQNQLSDDFEIHEEIKFIKNSTRRIEAMKPQREDDGFKLQKKRSVKFASPPSLTKVMVSKDISEVKMEFNSLKNKSKWKNLFPWIGGTIFSRNKGIQEGVLKLAEWGRVLGDYSGLGSQTSRVCLLGRLYLASEKLGRDSVKLGLD